MHEVLDDHLPLGRLAEADRIRPTGGARRAIAATAVVAWLLAAGGLLGAHLCELVGRAIAAVCKIRRDHLRRYLSVTIKPAALEIRALVVVDAEPGEPIEDDLHCLVGGTLAIRVFDPQEVLAAMAAGV